MGEAKRRGTYEDRVAQAKLRALRADAAELNSVPEEARMEILRRRAGPKHTRFLAAAAALGLAAMATTSTRSD